MAHEKKESPVEEPYIFTTIRYDARLLQSAENTAASCNTPCPFYMLEHHFTRLQVAKWSTPGYHDEWQRGNSRGPSYLLQGLLKAVKQWEQCNPNEKPEGFRLKLRNYASGRITSEIWPVQSVPLSTLFPTSFDLPLDPEVPVWTVFLDVHPTEPDETTMFKMSDRTYYGRARAAVGIQVLSATQEVLLFTPEGFVIDASISTPYFRRNGRWVTPSSSCGGQQGTTRRWALENGFCDEEPVSIASIEHGEILWLSNAIRGYVRARFVKRDAVSSSSKTDSVQEHVT